MPVKLLISKQKGAGSASGWDVTLVQNSDTSAVHPA